MAWGASEGLKSPGGREPEFLTIPSQGRCCSSWDPTLRTTGKAERTQASVSLLGSNHGSITCGCRFRANCSTFLGCRTSVIRLENKPHTAELPSGLCELVAWAGTEICELPPPLPSPASREGSDPRRGGVTWRQLAAHSGTHVLRSDARRSRIDLLHGLPQFPPGQQSGAMLVEVYPAQGQEKVFKPIP